MRKVMIFLLILLMFLASMGVGYFYLNTRNDQKKSSKIEENEIVVNNVENEYIVTQNKEEKISPNADLITTVYYGKCGHTISNCIEVPIEIVNMNENEIRERYEEWKINYFSEKEIAIYKENEGTCPEHYIVGSSEGVINIYRLNESGEEELYETTSVYIEYLPEKDQQELQNKIEIIGKENLYALLENYE